MTQDTVMETLAAEALEWFETRTRLADGAEARPYVTLKDDRPEWVQDLVHEAHGDMLPDDYRYSWARNALEALSEDEDVDAGEWADTNVSTYTSDRLDWAGSNLQRLGYCAQAVEEGLAGDTQDVVSLLGVGQYMELAEVFALVRSALEDRAAELDES